MANKSNRRHKQENGIHKLKRMHKKLALRTFSLNASSSFEPRKACLSFALHLHCLGARGSVHTNAFVFWDVQIPRLVAWTSMSLIHLVFTDKFLLLRALDRCLHSQTSTRNRTHLEIPSGPNCGDEPLSTDICTGPEDGRGLALRVLGLGGLAHKKHRA